MSALMPHSRRPENADLTGSSWRPDKGTARSSPEVSPRRLAATGSRPVRYSRGTPYPPRCSPQTIAGNGDTPDPGQDLGRVGVPLPARPGLRTRLRAVSLRSGTPCPSGAGLLNTAGRVGVERPIPAGRVAEASSAGTTLRAFVGDPVRLGVLCYRALFVSGLPELAPDGYGPAGRDRAWLRPERRRR